MFSSIFYLLLYNNQFLPHSKSNREGNRESKNKNNDNNVIWARDMFARKIKTSSMAYHAYIYMLELPLKFSCL